jgi:hypothetical protein
MKCTGLRDPSTAGDTRPYLLQLTEVSPPMLTQLTSLRPAVRLGALALACAIACPVFLSAQQNPPLAEVAKKEAERRKGIKQTGKVITTKDLPESARKPAAAGGGGTASSSPTTEAATTEQKPAAGDAASGQKDEKYWRGRLTSAQEGLRRSQAFADALQSRINALATDFVNRDDPYQRAKIGQDRQDALAELDRVKAEIESFKKQLVDIEEEARKAGVPPGWLR